MSYEEEDMILPDDFEDTSDTPSLEGDETSTESDVEDTPTAEGDPTTEDTEQTIEQQLFKLKYNHEELELPLEEVTRYAQMGMNYDKVQARLQELENDPRLSFVENLAKENGFDNPNDFLKEFQVQQEQARLDELIQQNIPEEYAKEMLESRRFREEQQRERELQQQQQAEQRQYVEFFETFRQANGKDFNPETDKIPQEVLDANAQGVPLKYAYMEHHNKQLQQQLQVYKQNESNKKKAPVGNITKHGSTEIAGEDDFLSGFDNYFK